MQDNTTQLEPIASESSRAGATNKPAARNPTPSDGVLASTRSLTGWKRNLDWKFWRRQVSVVTGHEACRDHFANERTFLGYLRTSSAFATLGIMTVQLFLLGDQRTRCKAQYGKGLALACEGIAIVVALSGAYRFWRHQNSILRGKIHAGGWEVNAIGICGLIVTILTLVLVLLADCE